MSTALCDPPDLDSDAGSGIVARRAMVRWAVRLVRREWRQQLLVIAMLTLAVAAMIVASSVAASTRGEQTQATFGTGNTIVTLPGTDPHLAHDIAAITRRYGPGEVIESRTLDTGTGTQATLLAENPHGRYVEPMLALVSGSYPSGPGEAALTSQLESLYGVSAGGTWRYDGGAWRVTGIVDNPSNLLDQFALVAPGQLPRPDQVSVLLRTVGRLTGLPASAQLTLPDDNAFQGGPSPAVVVFVISVIVLLFIGLVAAAAFAVLAQRRLRALGMISSLGATEGDIRLVMIASGAAVGVVAAGLGTVIGFAAWFGYAPHLQADVQHVVDPLAVPWPVIIPGVALTVVTAMLAAWRPAHAAARIPVAAALSGRAPAPKAARWPAAAGAMTLAGGLALLAFSGGWAGQGTKDTAFLAVGLGCAVVGGFLLAPACVRVLAVAAGPRAPVAVRIALRDLSRYQARSGAALAAVSLAVFLAMLTCLVASFRFTNPLDWTGPNLAPNEMLAGADQTSGQTGEPPVVRALAAHLHATSVLPLEEAGLPGYPHAATLWQEATVANNFSGHLYVATSALLAKYRIKPSQITPDADVVTMRPGLAAEPRLELTICPTYTAAERARLAHEGLHLPPCPPSATIHNPVIQTAPGLPSGTSEPNTLITMHAVRQMRLHVAPGGWLIQAPAPLTATQISNARTTITAAGGQIETKTGQLSLTKIGDGVSAAGMLIALAVLAMSVGLVRSETSSDLRTLAATGASARTRRAITAATAGALGLLGAVLGTATACLAVIAWVHGSLNAIFVNVPGLDYLLILAGLPLAATGGGWLFAGREPPVITRQPIE
jgi:putative ABC transport system permease protein